MKTNQNEFLSAVLDDEAGEFERRRLLDELCDDAALGKTLNRYSLMGEAMRAPQRTFTDSGSFLAGIQAQLEDEPAYNEVMVPIATNHVVQGGNQGDLNSVRPSGMVSDEQPWYHRKTGRYAVAASVAVAALAGVLLLQNDGAQPRAPETVVKTETPAVKPVTVVAAEATATDRTAVTASVPVASRNQRMALTTASLDQRTADTLKQYVTLHMQYRSSNGIAPSIQAVSYAQ